MNATFAQHSRLLARPGKRDALVEKFRQAAELQRDNPACKLMLVSTAPDQPEVVFLTEVWTTEADHAAAVKSERVQQWAKGMSELVAGPPQTQRLVPVGAAGVSL